jgi:hypothetical protein
MKGIKLKSLILAAVLAWSATGATPVTLDFTEKPASTLVDGMSIVKGGITFSFSNPSAALHVFNVGAPAESFVQDPVIDGNTQNTGITSQVIVAFSAPVSNVAFGMEVSIPPGSVSFRMATVTLTLLDSSTVTLDLPSSLTCPSCATDPFAEGQFTFNTGGSPVTKITVTPTPTGAASFTSFSFDNLTITAAPTPPPSSSVPAATPLTLTITAIGLAGLTRLLLRKQSV